MKERNRGIDLMRLMCMLMVVTLHVLTRGGVQGASSGANYATTWLLGAIVGGAVDGYALISGYVGFGSRHRYGNIARMWLQTAFWSVGLTALSMAILPDETGLSDLIRSFFPVITKRYWYFSAYFALFFLMPLLDAAVEHLERRSLRNALAALLALAAVDGLWDAFEMKLGFSVIWLAVLYLVGAYLKKYQPLKKVGNGRLLADFALCAVAGWVFRLMMEYWNRRALADQLFSYCSPTVVAGMILLLERFSRMKLERAGRAVEALAPLAFGVYIIHLHPLIWNHLINGRFAFLGGTGSPLLLIAGTLGGALAIFAVCLCAEAVRALLFRVLRRRR